MRTHKKFRGRHKFVCDYDGMVYYSEHKRTTWDGFQVHEKNLTSRQSQDLIKSVKENTAVPNPRHEMGEGSYSRSGYVEEGYVQGGYVELIITGDYTYITETNAEREALL